MTDAKSPHGSSTARHVASVLRRIDTQDAFTRAGARLLRAIPRSRDVRAAIIIVESWLQGESVKLNGVDPLRSPTLPDAASRDLRDGSAMLFLLLEGQKSLLSSTSVIEPERIKSHLVSLESDLVPTLLADLRRRETTSPQFARELDRARQSVDQVADSLGAIRSQVAAEVADDELLSDDDLPQIVKLDAAGGLIIFLILMYAYYSAAPKEATDEEEEEEE